MPGQPSPTIMDKDVANGVDFCLREICDDPSTSLTVSSPILEFELDQTDFGNLDDDPFDESGSSSIISEEDIAENWDPFLYTLQAKAPKPKCVICKKEVDSRPSYYGEEYHGLLSREAAERLLGDEDGRYLTRENPRGEHILSFMLDGKMWNYRLYYEDEGHFVGDKKFDKVEELVEDGLITMFLKKHDAGRALEKGRSLARQKTIKLRRTPCRRMKGRPKFSFSNSSKASCGDSVSSETQVAVLDFRRSISSEPRINSEGSDSEPRHISVSAPLTPRHGSVSAPLTPNSDTIQSDLDFTLPTQRRASPPLDVPYNFQLRKRSNCLDAEAFADRRKCKSSENLHGATALLKETKEAKGKYSPVLALRDAVRAEKAEMSRSMDLLPLVEEGKPEGLGKKKNNNRRSFSPSVRPKSTVGLPLALALSFGIRSKSVNTRSTGALDKVSPLPNRGFTLPVSSPVRAHKSVSKRTSDSVYSYYKAHKFQPHTYMGPTWCTVCHHYLWGLKQQGLQCRDCGMNSHHQCIPMAMNQECKPTRKMIKKVYGVDLTTLVSLEGKKIPTILRDCIHEIEARDMSFEGIYRVSGRTSEIIELKDKWDSGDPVDFSQYTDVNIITGAVKLYLRELPIPLISFDTYSEIMKQTAAIIDMEDPKANWQPLADSLKLLAKSHYNVLKYLAQHLHRIEQQSAENKMSASNLAVVFAPTLMRPPSEDLTLFKDFCVQRHFVEYIILKHDVLFDD